MSEATAADAPAPPAPILCQSITELGPITWHCQRPARHTGLHYAKQLSQPSSAVMWCDETPGPVEYLVRRFEAVIRFVDDVREVLPIVTKFGSYQGLPHHRYDGSTPV